jgi:hypothetical protein
VKISTKPPWWPGDAPCPPSRRRRARWPSPDRCRH